MNILSAFCELGGVGDQSQHAVENFYLISLFLM